MKRLLAFSVAIALIATACSEDNTTNPTDGGSYISTKAGTYIIHEMTFLERDTLTGDIAETYLGDDSVVVVGTETKADIDGVSKSAVKHDVFFLGFQGDPLYMAQEGSQTWYLYDFTFEVPGVGELDFGERWIMIGDANASGSQTGYNKTLTGYQFDYNGIPLTADITLTVTTEAIGVEQYAISGTTVDAKRYKLTISMNMVIAGFGTIPIELPGEIVLAKDLGLVFQENTPTKVELAGVFEQDIPGARAEGIRHMIP